MENIAIYGIYATRGSAERAVDRLRAQGFSAQDVSILFSSAPGERVFAHENSTKAQEGSAAGAISGATIGGVLGWLAGTGTLVIPGAGPLIAAGPIMATLAGLGVGSAIGGIAGALIGLGVPEYEARRYEGRINSGGVLLSVHADDDASAETAREILKRTGAEDISKKCEAPSVYSSAFNEEDEDQVSMR